MTTPAVGDGKDAWREWARGVRAGVDFASISGDIVGHLRKWGQLRGDTRVLFYDPLPDEVDVTALADEVIALLTRTGDDGLTVHSFDAERETHRLGFSQPVAQSQAIDPTAVDVVLVPGLAFDRHGTRLGRGGGHYDRLLALLRPDVVVIGIAPQAAVVDRLPGEDHDVPMTHLATESGVAPVGSVPEMSASPVDRAREWIAGDPDAATQAALQAFVDAADIAGLEALMGAPLRFGTAGIRGAVGPGPARMNRATVIRVTRGVADYLKARGRSGLPVVVGFDARPDSRRFAEDTVGVLLAAGIPVHHFTDPIPTPLVAHQALRLGATLAIVVTASHNPPADNGYKVYDANGAQIIPPVDGDIAAAVEGVGPAAGVSRVEVSFATPTPGAFILSDEAIEMYLADLIDFRGEPPAMSPLSIVFTPLHGVSGEIAVEALRRAGHDQVTPVPEQFAADGSFPTVAFPNPEEPGALDLAEALAAEVGADLVLANDPDGDRLAVSVPVDGGWRRLGGNEIGILLGDFVLERTAGDRVVVNSIVSSPMLGSVARAHGARFESTLTGFKWICNAGLDLEAEGATFVFGFEEALGYAVGPKVRDKDGISAAVWFADLAAQCAAVGETVLDRLARLYVGHGLWVSSAHSITRQGPGGLAELVAGLDRLVTETPAAIGGLAVEAVTDYRVGGSQRPRWLPNAPLVVIHLEGGSRVLARPSGTEPKMKIYTDLRAEVGSQEDVPEQERALAARAEVILAEVAMTFGEGTE